MRFLREGAPSLGGQAAHVGASTALFYVGAALVPPPAAAPMSVPSSGVRMMHPVVISSLRSSVGGWEPPIPPNPLTRRGRGRAGEGLFRGIKQNQAHATAA